MTERLTIQWIILLSFALVAPVQLPTCRAGAKKIEFRRRKPAEPLLANGSYYLRHSPFTAAPILDQFIDVGVPMKVLKEWEQAPGSMWLLVKTPLAKGWVCLQEAF